MQESNSGAVLYIPAFAVTVIPIYRDKN